MRELLRFFRFLPSSLVLGFIVYLPGFAGIILRRWYYGRSFRRCGRGLTILPGVHIEGAPFIEVGDDVTIRENVVLRAGRQPSHTEMREVLEFGSYEGRERGVVSIGDRSRIAFGAIILGYGGMRIGAKCGIGPYAVLLSESFHHQGKDPARVYKYSQGADPQELCVLRGHVELRDGAGVASNVIVLPGATIGRDSWVAPQSVVRIGGVIPDDVVAKGDPASPVFSRRYASSRPAAPRK